jgi:hypothetical protein
VVSVGRSPASGEIENTEIASTQGRGRAIVIFIKRTETITELAV